MSTKEAFETRLAPVIGAIQTLARVDVETLASAAMLIALGHGPLNEEELTAVVNQAIESATGLSLLVLVGRGELQINTDADGGAVFRSLSGGVA